jgi:hypothetical protein
VLAEWACIPPVVGNRERAAACAHALV